MGGGSKKKKSVLALGAGAGAAISPALAPEAPGTNIPFKVMATMWGLYWDWQFGAFKKYQAGEISPVELYTLANEKAQELGIPVPLGIGHLAVLSSDQEKLKEGLAPHVETGEVPKPSDFDYIGVFPVDSDFWGFYDDQYAKFLEGKITYEQFQENLQNEAAKQGYVNAGVVQGEQGPFTDVPASAHPAQPAGEPGGTGKEEGAPEAAEAAPFSPSAPPPAWLLEASPVREDFWDGVAEAGPLGRPFLVAGPDIEDQTLTATLFRDPGGDSSKSRLVLFGKVREESEAKLLDALDLEGGHTVKVKRQVEKEAPLPLDEQEGLYAQLLKVAKSVNHHTGEGKDNVIPDHTLKGMAELRARLEKLQGSAQDEKVQAMLEHYVSQLKAVESAVAGKTKAPFVTQFTASQTVEVEEEVVVPAGKGEGLPARKRTGSRINASESGGSAVWDGTRNEDKFYGVEYLIDLGDGYQAVYHPNDKSVPYSLRGTLELIAPPGVNDGRGALQKLNLLHLHAGPPASAEEAEVMYLERNVWAQGYEKDPEYRAVGETLKALEMKQEAKLLAALDGAASKGLAEEEMLALAKELVLQNQRALLAEKTRLLKRFFERKLGLAPGGLDKLPTYRPVPAAAQSRKGFHFWNRFDLTPEAVREKTKGYCVVHEIKTAPGKKVDILCRMIENGGVLASTELRRRMGVKHSGVSSEQDMVTGGASYAFCFFRKDKKQKDFDIVWDPEALLTRSDWFATKGDDFGAVNPENAHYSVSGRTRKVEDLPEYESTGSGSWRAQIMFKNGVDLFGAHPPRAIFVDSENDRQKVLASFAKVGVKELGGRPVEDVVKVR
ncbi:hypothetical protein [Desulfofundulus sp.]|uniref:hypothetical protein n=1 Tax=Desulfofundulus sp. TaxID=2282750 RepID=UPI003C75F4D8